MSKSTSRLRALRGRFLHHLARFALSLPASVQVKLSGGKPVVIDGLTLHPELQLMFALQKVAGAKRLTDGDPLQCRRRMRRDTLDNAGPRVEVGAVRDLFVAGGAGPIRARHYAPANASNAPLLVFFHGGGFVLGDLDTHDPGCRLLCKHAGVHVLAIDYRLAPEHPFPAAVDDAIAAFRWVCANAAALGADPTRIGVSGDSAGAHLSCVLSTHLVHAGERAPSMQLMLYPPIDAEVERPSIHHFGKGFLIEKQDMVNFQHWYTGHLDRAGPIDPRALPLHALKTPKGLRNHPPSIVVTAGFDPLRDEGEAYAAHLEAAGNSVVKRRFDDMVHGFIHLVGVSNAARDVMIECAGIARAVLETAPAHTERSKPSLRSVAS